MIKLKYDGFVLSKGTNIYDFFLIPTIRIEQHSWDIKIIALEWLNFYIGTKIYFKLKESD